MAVLAAHVIKGHALSSQTFSASIPKSTRRQQTTNDAFTVDKYVCHVKMCQMQGNKQ